MTYAPLIDRDIDTLLGSASVGLADISAQTVRAVFAAYAQPCPNLTAFAMERGVTIEGDRLCVHKDVAGCERAHAHRSLALALFVGAGDVTDVLPELVAHAVAARSEFAEELLEPVFTSVRRSQSRECRYYLAGVFRQMPTTEPIRPWFGHQLFRLHLAAGDPADDIKVVGEDIIDHVGSAANIAMEMFLNLPPDDTAQVRARLVEEDPLGWGLSLEAARAAHETNAEDDAREQLYLTYMRVVHTAMEQRNPHLLSSALTSLSYRSSDGDIQRSITLAKRAVVQATRAELWPTLVNGHIMLTWLFVENLQLREAQEQARALVQLIALEGLTTFRELAHLLEARVSAMSGVPNHDGPTMDESSARSGGSSLQATFNAVCQADLLSTIGSAQAEAAWADLQRLIDDGRDNSTIAKIERSMTVALVESRLFPEQRAWERIPDLVEDEEIALVAEAICWLARHVVLGDVPEARDTLVRAVQGASRGRRKMLDLALDEAAAVLDRDWQQLDGIRLRWAEHGFVRDAALVAACVGCLAAESSAGVEAGRRFDIAHHSLAGMGLSADVKRVRAARTKSSIASDAQPAADTSGILGFFDSDPKARSRVADLFVRRVIPRGERFPADCACTITSGIATLDFGEPDAPIELVTSPGAVHLERIAGFGAASDELAAVAMTPCAVDMIPISALAVELARSPSASNAFMSWLVARSQRELLRARRLVTKSVESRVASVLLDVADGLGVGDSGEWGRLPISRIVLGSLAGTTRESASRAISNMTRTGVVEVKRNEIFILDRPKCESLAGDAS